MTRFRKHCLIISLSCFVICGLIISLMSCAEPSMYGIVTTDRMGYDTGYGITADADIRRGIAGAEVSGAFLNRKKHHADSGYSYSAHTEARLFPISDFYAGIGYGTFGYQSRFDGGSVWRKRAETHTFSMGYDNGPIECGLTYFPKESDTVNRTEHFVMSASWPVYERVRFLTGFGVSRYDQSGKRETGWSSSMGAGYGF